MNVSYRLFGEEFTKIEVPGDGSCLVHSICTAVDRRYNALKTDEEKRAYARDLRKDLASGIVNETVFQEYIAQELPGIRDSHFPGEPYSKIYQTLADELLSNRSLYYYHAPILGFYFSLGN